MTKRQLPALPENRPRLSISSELSPSVLERWNSGIRASSIGDENTISIFDEIGFNYWTGEGVTAKRIGAVLRSLNGEAVTVNVNSPGGDMFEGIAIYNQLREYSGAVTVKILGLAASAASIIAMAGDDIQISQSAFLMIHNCWGAIVGNRHDFVAAAEKMTPFDSAMQDVYAARSGMEKTDIGKMMDAETWINGTEAVEKGFADSLLSTDSTLHGEESPVVALRKIDALLVKNNVSPTERKRLLKALQGNMPKASLSANPEILSRLDDALIKMSSH